MIRIGAMVRNKDVGFARASQMARVKADTINFNRYGLIDGKVLDATRDAVTLGTDLKQQTKSSEQGQSDGMGSDASSAPVYIAHIALNAHTIVTEAGRTKFSTGMQVSAEIQTGQRRVIEYLLSPLVRHVDGSLRERWGTR